MKLLHKLVLFCLAAALVSAPAAYATAQASAPAKSDTSAAPIDINSATAEQLQTVPGISAAVAKKIIAGRPYTSKYDIVKKGFITQKTYEGIKGMLAAKWGAAGTGATAKTGADAASGAPQNTAAKNTSTKTTATQVAQGDNKDLALSIRQIIDKYYKGVFWMGGAPGKEYQNPANQEKLAIFQAEFPYVTPANSFKQSTVYLEPGAPWQNQEYMKWIELARANNQVIRSHGPISPQCSAWAKDPARTAKELFGVMAHYMTTLATELEKNKDVVRWMDVVNETVTTPENVGGIYKKGDWFGPLPKGTFWQNPWLKIGTDDKSGIPLYIIMAFEMANKYAPGIKKIYNHNGGGTNDDVAWDKVKETVLYLRSLGQRVDGIGWQAHVDLGWEKNPANKKGISKLIDWCYANNLEFHITELDVRCPSEKTWLNDRKAQAATIKAVVDTALEKVGKGTVSINFWDITSGKRDLSGKQMKYFGGVWPQTVDYDDPVYIAIKRSLLEHAK